MIAFYQYLNHWQIGVWKNLKNHKDPDYLESSLVHKISQELNDLVRVFDLSRTNAQILGSGLQQ